MDEGAANQPARTGGGKRVLRWSAMAFALALLAVSLVAVRLSLGPMALPQADRLAYRVLADFAGPDGRVAVGSVSVAFDRARRLMLVVDDLAMTGPAGRIEAPRISIDVSLPALASGRIVGREIEVASPTVELAPFASDPAPAPTTTEETAAPPAAGPVEALERLDARLQRLVDLADTYGFERFRLTGGRVIFPGTDHRLPPPTLTDLDIAADVGKRGAVDVNLSGATVSGVWQFAFERRVNADDIRLTAWGRDLTALDLLPSGGPLSRGFQMSPYLEASLSPSGEARAIIAELLVEEGVFKFGRDPERTLDQLAVAIDWRAGDAAFTIDRIGIDAGATEVVLKGTLTPPAAGDTAWRYQVESEVGRMAPPDVAGPPLVVDTFRMAGAIDPARSLFTFDEGIVIAPLGVFRAAGSFAVGPDGPSFAGAAEIAATTVDTMKKLWPPVTAHDARAWLVNEVHGGVIERASANFALTPEDLDGLPETDFYVKGGIDVEIAFRDGSLRLPGDLPALQRARGTARIRDREAGLLAETAILDVADREPIMVRNFTAVVEDLAARPPPGRVRASITGTMDAVAAVAAGEPVNALDTLDLTPDDLSGTVSADLTLSGPFDDPVDPDLMHFTVDATLEDVASAVPVAGQDITDGNLRVTATPERFSISGTARLDGIEAEIDYFEVADRNGDAGNAEVVLTDALRRSQGWDLDGRIKGPIPVRIDTDEDGNERLVADLSETAITIPELGFTKAKGAAGTVTATVERSDGKIVVPDLVFEAGEAYAEGAFTIDKAGVLQRAALSRVRFGSNDEIGLTIMPRPGGGYAVRLDADRIDGKRILDALDAREDGDEPDRRSDPDEATGGPPIALSGRIGRLSGKNGLALADIAFEGLAAGANLKTLKGSARLTGSSRPGELEVSVTPIGSDRRKANVRIDNVGDALRLLGGYDRMRGGSAAIDMAVAADGGFDGTINARDFEITGEPRLEEIIATAGSTAGTRGRDPRPLAFQDGGGQAAGDLPFNQLTVDFTGTAEAITLKDAVLRGPVIGGTGGGVIDLAGKRVNLTGTVIPAYAINNLFGRVPMLGGLLGAGRSGGLIGVTFRLAGALDSPDVSINPISAVAPGIFRKVFEYN